MGIVKNMDMIEKISWEDFRSSGMLWWVNRMIHLFGLAIVVEIDSDGKISEVFPARCKFRGFSNGDETKGFEAVTNHLSKNIVDLKKDLES